MKKYIAIALLLVLVGITAQAKEKKGMSVKPKLMWLDAEANFARFSSKDSITFYLAKLKQIGFTDVVLDIRPITGEVFYDSKVAPKMRDWDGHQRADFEYVGYFIEESHKLGLRIHLSLNVFVAGHNFFSRGLCYMGHSDWASMVYTPDQGIVPITSVKKKYSAMVNPINPDYQKHFFALLEEVVKRYPKADGVILDRFRYDGIMGDFSDLSKAEFERYLGKAVAKFPDDIYTWKKDSTGKAYYDRGPLFKKWIEWRARNIYNLMAKARATVKKANPKISFGTYTGAWYPSYFEVGVNWASKKYDPSKEYDWATESYKNYGYAELLDLYTTGNYYFDVTKEEYLKAKKMVLNETDSKAQSGLWYCVEGSCERVRTILKGKKVYGGILADMFYSNPSQLARSVEMNIKASDGLMVFDIVHIIHKNMWKELEEGIKNAGE